VLDANGALLDVTLLAAVAALASLRLPAVRVSEEGSVVPDDALTMETQGALCGSPRSSLCACLSVCLPACSWESGPR
jgi:exosome complex RNA-binding protein Rrp42 (RNase PH superfamily)